MSDIDPLSTYDYSYGTYGPINTNSEYPYNVKLEPLINANNSHVPSNAEVGPPNIEYKYESLVNNDLNEQLEENIPQNNDKDTKEDIKPIITDKKVKKERKKTGKTSSYWNKKVADSNFPFYGCTICNISFPTSQDLDQHVTIHKGRLTSYDIRLRNQLKRKKLKKEQKKLKKSGKKVKTEKFEIDIKPEDGYIGNEVATDYQNNGETENNAVNQNIPNPEDSTGKSKEGPIKDGAKHNLKEDPRLQKLFKCFACQKQFSLSYYLRLHVRSHTDEKPYTCAECGQSFITASKLGRHNKRIHLAIRYQCRICYRFFSRFEYLTRHFDKKHPEDKLEGEPYDYNAILPYLKELEEQLRDKTEGDDKKPKTEDLWPDCPNLDQFQQTMDETPLADDQKVFIISLDQFQQTMDETPLADDQKPDYKVEVEIKKDEDSQEPQVNIMLEEVNMSFSDDVEVKLERDVECDDVKDDDAKDDSVKNESYSDDDFFPSNTWAATPEIEEPPLPPPQKKRYKSSQFPKKCEFCDKIINSASYMRIHVRIHSGEKPFKCYICNRGFITSSKMHRHVLTHNESWGDGEDQVKLDVKMETDDMDDDTKLKESIKKAKAKFGKKLPKDAAKKRRCHQKRPFSCVFCHKRFLHKETLQIHKKSHEGEEIVLKCNFCLEVMSDEQELTAHEATHSGAKPYICTVCQRCYTKRETLVYHRKTHAEPSEKSQKNEFICDICSKTFNSQCKLQRHIISHRSDKFVLRYECPVCAHMFNTKYHVQMHLATHQKEGLILEENRNEILAMVLQNARKIPKQSESSANISDLIPPDERSRVCNICGQVFQHFYYLEEHLKSHGSKIAISDSNETEERKHICQVCNKGFKLHYYLKLHSFTHTKEKPFICQQCGKGFITKGKLKRHLESHTGLKKYQCHICYKFFTRPSYLRIHVRTIHGTQDYNFSLEKQYLLHDTYLNSDS